MIELLPFAQLPGAEDVGANLGAVVLKVLAVAGAALIGGLGVGFGVQIAVRMMFAAKVPPPVVKILQIVGGVAAAWIAAFLLFYGVGGGGDGPGPGKGPGDGGTTQAGSATTKPSTGSTGTQPVSDPPKPADVFEVEVLTLPKGGGVVDPIYRVRGATKMYTAKELADEIDRRKTDNKDLTKLEILLYENSPDRDKQQVTELERLAGLKGLTPSVTKARGDAP